MTKARDIASAIPAPSTVSSAELGYLDGVTSAIQTQIDSKIGSASAINPTIVDAKGDIIAATAADTVARLAIGANGTTLVADSSEATGLKWATPATPASGANFISRTTFSAVSGVNIDSIFSNTYDNYMVVGNFFDSSTTTTDVQMQGRYSTTTHTANYYYGFSKVTYGGVASQVAGSAASQWVVGNAGGGGADEGGVINFNIHREASSQLRITGQSFATQVGFAASGGGWVFSTQAWTGLRFTPVSGTFSGTVIVYGLAKS
jgi:hypothetical protein